ncbi:MAG: hypothetical protein ABIK62_00815 [candidate division WOR-3 bacterium]
MWSILPSHAQRYPLWQIEDLYKLTHQAAFGSEHAIPSPSRARSWLVQELELLGSGPTEPLLDAISPGGDVVRVHLRPFRKAGLEPELLLQGFLRTAQGFKRSTDRLLGYAQIAEQLAREGRLSFAARQVRDYFERMMVRGYPAGHHSEQYAQEYRPAYRVVGREWLPDEIIAAAQRLDQSATAPSEGEKC